ncbi:MAG: hydrogenase nickel incorporation protein HypA [Gammaproteobacteria bacterium]|nr:MAG: hydrogenase nickel incorporation protein HypA [Gammaproteobacteria bacterium]
MMRFLAMIFQAPLPKYPAMHELAICQDVLSQVRHLADKRGASRVDRIVVIIGPLAGVEIPLLERAFSVARSGTIAANAVLDVESTDIVVQCRTCSVRSKASIGKLTCGSCGDWRVDVRQGEEMLLKTVELSVNTDDQLPVDPASTTSTLRSSGHV